MSCFADKLKNALQVSPPPMGFFRSSVPAAGKPRMLLVAQLALGDFEAAPDLAKNVDAVLLTCNKAPTVKTQKALKKTAGDTPLGLWLTKVQSKAIEGMDFTALAAENALLSNWDTSKNGIVLSIPLDFPDNLAPALNNLPVESVLVNTSAREAFTWVDLMRLSRLGDLISKPLLAHVTVSISECEIKMLWDAGVDALVAPLSRENQADFMKLRATIDGLKLSPKRKWMKTSAIVPVVKQDTAALVSDDDDDIGDDE